MLDDMCCFVLIVGLFLVLYSMRLLMGHLIRRCGHKINTFRHHLLLVMYHQWPHGVYVPLHAKRSINSVDNSRYQKFYELLNWVTVHGQQWRNYQKKRHFLPRVPCWSWFLRLIKSRLHIISLILAFFGPWTVTIVNGFGICNREYVANRK